MKKHSYILSRERDDSTILGVYDSFQKAEAALNRYSSTYYSKLLKIPLEKLNPVYWKKDLKNVCTFTIVKWKIDKDFF